MKANSSDRRSLSKTVSHALRHEPESYGIELDGSGWTPVEELLSGLRRKSARWRDLRFNDLETMIASSSKRRFEIKGLQIRALYGHSLPDRIVVGQPVTPPGELYHGTAPEVVAAILVGGLRPMRRQYVHLLGDTETAVAVGRRKSPSPVLLKIHAASASTAGVGFYEGNDLVWLAEFVPAAFITRMEE